MFVIVQLHPGSVKVRSLIVSYVDNVLNVTASKDKKKGIRLRKSKENDGGGSIVSLTTSQLICRPVGKADQSVVVTVDGVEREGISLVRMQANWDLTPNRTFSIAVTSDVASAS